MCIVCMWELLACVFCMCMTELESGNKPLCAKMSLRLLPRKSSSLSSNLRMASWPVHRVMHTMSFVEITSDKREAWLCGYGLSIRNWKGHWHVMCEARCCTCIAVYWFVLKLSGVQKLTVQQALQQGLQADGMQIEVQGQHFHWDQEGYLISPLSEFHVKLGKGWGTIGWGEMERTTCLLCLDTWSILESCQCHLPWALYHDHLATFDVGARPNVKRLASATEGNNWDGDSGVLADLWSQPY